MTILRDPILRVPILREEVVSGAIIISITKGSIVFTGNSLFGADNFSDLTPASIVVTGRLTSIAQALSIDAGSITITDQDLNVNLQTVVSIDDTAIAITGQSLFGNESLVIDTADTIIITPKNLVALSTDIITIPAGSIVITGRQLKIRDGLGGSSPKFLVNIGKLIGR